VNPYLIEGPALISFSGGRTSAYMLHQIIQAHGGGLPDNVVVAFANTGKEREETLRFVHECGSRWGVKIHWLELLKRSGPAAERYEEVGFNSASRNGEPFARLIAAKQFKPNGVMRFCTEELKVKTIEAFLVNRFGWTTWSNVIGLRFDEGHRLLKSYAKNDEAKSPWRNVHPMDKARVTKADIMAFWSKQPFDLSIRPYESNCDLCFLKGRGILKVTIRENPGVADWWIEQERIAKGSFNKEWTYAELVREVESQPHLFDEIDADYEADVECGLVCQ